MTQTQLNRRARSYRLMAGRLWQHLRDGTAGQANCQASIKAAHDALCHAFQTIEEQLP